MSREDFPSFAEFFKAITGNEPYLWQAELADRVERNEWPGCIEIPTGLGKTATIAVAVYELARQLHYGGTDGRTAPQRIFHVVNRRSLVEGASRFIKRLEKRINAGANHPDTAPVRNALKKLLGPGDDRPIVVSEIHGQSNTSLSWLRATGRTAARARDGKRAIVRSKKIRTAEGGRESAKGGHKIPPRSSSRARRHIRRRRVGGRRRWER